MIRIGTSNWSQPTVRKHLGPTRLRPGEMLRAYGQMFDTVEINSTFYRTHQARTFAGWTERVPANFLFSIKAPRTFTHFHRLEGIREELSPFLASLKALGGKLGPILFQLPESFHNSKKILSRFLADLAWACDEAEIRPRFSFELRHSSWHVPEIFKLLEKSQVGFCIFDIKGKTSPLCVTSPLVYIRLHGPEAKPYQGTYGKKALEPWAEHLLGWDKDGYDCFVYFDNTQFDEAAPDALILRDLTGISDSHLLAHGYRRRSNASHRRPLE